MHVTMVKKQLLGGRACDKCKQADELLRHNGLLDSIHEVVWAVEGEPASPGMKLASRLGIDNAPFFIVNQGSGQEQVYTSVLKFIKDSMRNIQNAAGAGVTDRQSSNGEIAGFAGPAEHEATGVTDDDVNDMAERLGQGSPQEIINWALEKFGRDCAISFSGAEDVVLIELAARSGKPFSVFSLDTGRLHPETYEFLDRVRDHYGLKIDVFWPELVAVQNLVREKGLFSFYRDGHQECCSIRKVEPLRRALSKYRMWVTGQRRDQSPTRSSVEIIQSDPVFAGVDGPLLKLNPLAKLTLSEVWSFIREAGIPYNELHDRGFISIGCAPCTRVVRPGEHERAGRWSWEDATKRECGLHVTPPANYSI